MFDFGALPPEINSTRMYIGPGSGPMLAAAAAWDALAAQLETFGAAYSAATSALQGESWSGPASIAMAAAAAPYLAWVTTTSAQAEEAANQARAAAAAFETAFAATVPPALVAANRIQLAILVATNFFGQNTPAIAATEAAYLEMWAQDAAAMYGYAASSSAAATLTPFGQPPQTTSSAAQSSQGAAVAQAGGTSVGQAQTTLSQLMSAVPQQLQTLASGGSTNASTANSGATPSSIPLMTLVSDFDTLIGPLNLGYQAPYTVFQCGSFVNALLQSAVQATNLPKIAAPVEGAAAAGQTLAPQGVGEPVLASAGRAIPIGGLSVPQNWTAAIPAADAAAEPMTPAPPGYRALPSWASNLPPNAPGAMPAIGQVTNAAGRRGGNAVFRMRDRRYRMPRFALGG
jgi:PPE-repeat protein